MEETPETLKFGTEAVLYAILDAVVDEYEPVVKGMANDIDEIETQVFDGDPAVSRRIYELTREVIEFERAVSPLIAIIDTLSSGFPTATSSDELDRHLRDVADHVVQAKEHIEEFRVLLRDILAVNATPGRRAAERGGRAPRARPTSGRPRRRARSRAGRRSCSPRR